MIKLFTFSLSLFLSSLILAQVPAWTWAKSSGGAENETIKGVASDTNGNAYITGSFLSSSVVFGSYTLTNSNTFTSVPSAEMFLVKYNPAGIVLWAARAGGTVSESGNAVTTDPAGNVYVAGTFMSQSVSFGPFTLTKTNNSEDIFIVKYDPSGNVLWAKSALGDQQDVVNSIALDGSGNLYITGFSGSGTLTMETTSLTNSTPSDFIFVAKYDLNGNFIWARQATGNSSNIAASIAADGQGNAYITGYYNSSTLNFGTQTLTNTSVTQPPFSNSQGYDMFVAKYDMDGNITWTKNFGASEDEVGNSLIYYAGYVYVGGSYSSPVLPIGPITLTNMNSSGQASDLMLIKLNSSGNVAWAKSGAGMGQDYMHAITGTPTGNIVLTGHFKSSILSFDSQTVTSSGSDENMFVAQYDANGNAIWATGIGGGGNEEGTAVITNTMGDVYVAGYYTSGTVMVGTVTLNNSSNYTTADIFLGKIAGINGITSVSSGGNQIALYPNPSNGNVIIDLGSIKERDLIITVYNAIGTKVYEKDIYTNESMQYLDLSTTPKGAYILKIKILTEVYTKRIIIR
ncbi:MAG: SBBP repeat-containing protein [Bacteroidia bacterium]